MLRAAGTGLVLGAGAGVWRAWDQGLLSADPGPAYQPWTRWRAEPGDGPLAPVRAAILAANPHNSQPWLFRVSPARIDVFADPARNLGAIDPDRREMYIGVGCALENLVLAARATGYAPAVTLLPDADDPAHAARVDLVPAAADVSALYRAIPDRHTNRGPYDPSRGLEADVVAGLSAAVGEDARLVLYRSAADRARAAELICAPRKPSSPMPRRARRRHGGNGSTGATSSGVATGSPSTPPYDRRSCA